ncbi:MAG TPA: histidine phosphotransferase family protein [Paracoccaceae bacterium]|nr:histidine phosphotransferase family protein [Paracoccaceae bacterium]
MSEKPDLTALIGSRICHDLISPIGAIGNGVELLMMEGATKGPEIALISESVANANARIRFFRVAFGAATADQRISGSEVRSILSDITRGGRITIEWQAPADLDRREVKLAFLALQCLETAMPWGGRITADRGESRWTLTGRATRTRIEADLWEVLAQPSAAHDILPAQVHFLLLADDCARWGRRLTTELRETEIRVAF